MKTREQNFFLTIRNTISSLYAGLTVTLRHLFKARISRKPIPIDSPFYFSHTEGINTIQYPYEMQPIPDNGRYRLHNEIDDCIVCDKCAKICPVNCITIEPIKAIEDIGKTSDGTPKRLYAATFDIDMGKCCFCGLCTTVCPTECLTMTKVFDFSVTNMQEHVFAFSEMTETDIEEKKKILEQHQQNRLSQKPEIESSGSESTPPHRLSPAPGKPVFKPKIKPVTPPDQNPKNE
jgi:formate hydrogenlyase subunit 6/NADH:ubiquinone oxidoreductase subunit I